MEVHRYHRSDKRLLPGSFIPSIHAILWSRDAVFWSPCVCQICYGPESLTSLEKPTCRVLGDLLKESVVVKIADDLYCGGDTPSELLHNKETVLQALDKCALSL